jgi:PHD/YefM family antitoxin component YafN of YafNO toxin-antitoxin module
MTVYTFSEARQKLAKILEEARRKGGVRIKRRDGEEFVISPAEQEESPLAIEGVELDLTAEEIVMAVREMRERQGKQ